MRASNLKQLFAMVTKYSLILVAAIAILGGAAGFFLSGTNGLISALIGAAIAFVFSILTILRFLLAAKWISLVFMRFFGWLAFENSV
jgi:hypothetical protein